mgnify:CR=1 FL=1
MRARVPYVLLLMMVVMVQEDAKVIELVTKYGPKRWSVIAQHLKGRIGKQCRERYAPKPSPQINRERERLTFSVCVSVCV